MGRVDRGVTYDSNLTCSVMLYVFKFLFPLLGKVFFIVIRDVFITNSAKNIMHQ